MNSGDHSSKILKIAGWEAPLFFLSLCPVALILVTDHLPDSDHPLLNLLDFLEEILAENLLHPTFVSLL